MYKIIGGDGKEYGPASAEEIRRWFAEGRLNRQTLLQAADSTDWKPLSDFPEFASIAGIPAGPPPLITATGPATDPATWSAQVLGQPSEIDIGRCLSRGIELVKANFGLLLGATFLIWLIAGVSQWIPIVGPLLYLVFRGVLWGGLFLVFLKRIRGQQAGVGDTFSGFSLAFAQLMLAGLVTYVLSVLGVLCCLIIPGVYLAVAWIFSVPLVADKRLEFWSAMELSRKVVTRVWFPILGLMIVALLPVILVTMFVQGKMMLLMLPVIQDAIRSGQPDLPRLMETVKHLTLTLLPLTLLTQVVVLFNLPFALAALMYAYEDLFSARTARTA
jgi:hypothetical protein